MRKQGKLTRLLSMILAVAMCLSFLPWTALALEGDKTAALVTDVTELAAGDRIIIAAAESDTAMSTNQKSTNRGTAAVTKDGSVITLGADVQVITLENGTKAGTWAFRVDEGYLYAAGKTKAQGASKNQNYLKTQTTLDDNGSWSVSIADGVATVIAQGENGCNNMRYNKTSGLFSCYISGQENISIYKIVETAEPEPTEEPTEETAESTEEPTESTEPDVVVVPIDVALGASEGTFTVKGVVTLVDGLNYYVQDETGAICVRLGTERGDIVLGSTVLATGSRGEFNGLPQLGSATLKSSDGMTLSAKDITLGSLTKSDLCTYIRITGLTVTGVTANTITVTDGTNSIEIYNPVTGDAKIKKDDVLTFTGALGIYGTKYQLRNTLAEEIQLTYVAPDAAPDYRTWTQVSLEEIQAGDTIAITMTKDGTTWVLPNVGEGSKKQPLVAAGTVDGTTLTTDGAEKFAWSVSTAEGGYHIKNGDSYLYVNADNNGVRIGSTAAVWSVDSGYLTAKDSKDVLRYLGVYDGTDWRCYTSINATISGQSLSFWRLNAPEEKDPWADEDAKYSIYQQISQLQDGDKVVIFNNGNGKAVSSQFNGYYLSGADATVKEAGYIASEAENIVWTVSVQETDGVKVYTFRQGDDVVLGILKSGTYFNLKTGVGDTADTGFTLEKTGDTAYMYYVYSSTLEGTYGHVYLEWYAAKNGFSPYCTGADRLSETNFGFTFYKLVREGVKEEEPEVPDTPALTVESGEYVIWDVTNNKALSSERTKEGSYYYKGVDVTEADGVLSGYGETEIWTVTVTDGVLTISAGTETLGMSGSYGSISNATGCTTWTLEDAGDGAFYIKNTETGKYITFDTGFSSWQAKADKAAASRLKMTKPVDDTKPASGIADGKYVIWNPTHKVAVSNTFNSSNYMLGTAVTPVGDTVTGYSTVDIWIVTNNDDGTITITQDGKYFGNNAGGYIAVAAEVANPNWKIVPLDDGTVYLSNVGSGKDLEWFATYSDWSMYYFSEADRALYALRFTPASTVYATDSEVVKDIAQWGGGGPYDSATNASQVNGDRYVVGDQKDDKAAFTVRADGKQGTPFQATTTSTGGTNYYMGGTNIGKAEGDYMQFAVNTAGWAGMTLAFRLRATNAGPGSFQLCYSTDNGTTWSNFNTGSYAYSYTAYPSGVATPVTGTGSITDGVARTSIAPTNYVSFAFDVPSGADNCPNLLIRLVPGSDRADGDTVKKVSGNIRVDSVVFSGSPVVDKSVTTYVTVEPNGEEDQPVGTALTMTSEAGAEIWYRVNGGEWKLYTDSAKPTLESLPCNVEAYAKAEGKSASAVMLYSYAAGTTANVKMDPNGGGVFIASSSNRVITMTCATEGATIYYMVSKDNKIWPEAWTTYTGETTDLTLEKDFEKLYVKAYAVKEGFKDSNVVTRTFTERSTDSYSLYFGQLHSHTNISDGAGSIEEAYYYAKNTADHIDFLAVTDHSNSFDNTGSGVLAEDASLVSEEWKTAKETAQDFTDENFVGIYGYEMTWSNGLGHINTYNTPGFQSRTQSDYSTYSTALLNYYNTLTTVGDSISQFNHPGTTFGDFQDFAYYTEAYDELITLIEVGNGEGAVGSSGYFPSYEYYTRALDKGWHVAPTNNQDNHKGLWGNANTGRSVVLADSLTEEGIYDAMRNYRVYATEDNDLQIYYTLNDNVMGSILDLDSGDMLTLQLNLHDPTDSNIGKVEVIVNGGLSIASQYVPGHAEEAVFKIPNEYSYYYIKVTQDDGDIAVTAPVWTGDVESVGISSFSTDAALPVQNQEMNLTLELYNNVKNSLKLESVVFQLGDGEGAKIIHTADLTGNDKVPAKGTFSYSFAYTHPNVGTADIYAVVTGELNGVEKVYKEKLALTFVTPKMVTRVIVDGTHYNDYVSGYYGGNINNLPSIAAESQIEVNVVTDQITAEMLEQCELLIISAPARKAGTSNTGDYTAKPFEDEFLQLVKNYVDAGGSVIVCGLADYQDNGAASADLHAAAQLNKLLEAIDSTMRINDDEVYDEVNNGGQAYRLYPENFNMESRWCQGLVEGQTYSQYSGCTVDVGKGTWLVRGFDTTYSIDSDGDKLGGVAEGDAVMLAVEETGKGGNIFVAGGVFVSDFEVKAELDNIWDLPYANRTIIENIMGAVRVQLPLSTIEEMRKGDMGDVFRIRGYVTAGTDNANNTFFDAIYVQDATGGTTVFPFSLSGVALGTPIEIIGYVDAYQGDKEIQIMSYTILNDAFNVIEPEKMSNKDAMDYNTNGGELIQVEGEVVSVISSGENGVAQFVVKDANGDLATVFIDGYILSGTTGKNELASIVKVGNTVSAVGLLYMHPEGDSDVSVPVLRVRNCDEILLVKEGAGETDPTEGTEGTEGSEGTEGTGGTKPDATTKPGSGGNANTGDDSMIPVAVVLLVSAALILAILLVMAHKRKKDVE